MLACVRALFCRNRPKGLTSIPLQSRALGTDEILERRSRRKRRDTVWSTDAETQNAPASDG
jgi:hypothetical protein